MVDLDRNMLGAETSPYLLQHKDNPVHWQAWSAETLAAAKAAGKPILLSIGYAACHWCHVMAHESFEDPGIAGLMNELFVNIKVDREERPDLDYIYQHALHLLGERGGWPLTMFLTPDGAPFWGGTYFPPAARYGRPGFGDVLQAVAKAYHGGSELVPKNTAALGAGLARLAQPASGSGISLDLTDRIVARLAQEVDRVDGGIGHAPKFPQVPVFELLWRGWKRCKDTEPRDAVLVTLDHISQGGIYDHLGGGFSRYSVDERWLVPHFEKMLYDNAGLIELLTLVWQETRSPLHAQRVAETIGWAEREMLVPEGGFASSLDADSEHEEGKFYVWTEEEVRALLGGRADRFKTFYEVSRIGNWEEGKTILNRLDHIALVDAETEAELAADRAVLLEARSARIRPGLDDKVLTDWNGLMIAALAKAGSVFGEPRWIDLAARSFAFIAGALSTSDGRLYHSWREGKARHAAVLDDYANMSRAALALHEATGETAYLDQTRSWIEIIDRHYWDAAGGGYFFTADDAEALIARTKTAQDAPLPSGNGTLVGVLARLYFLTGEERFRERAEAIIRTFSGELQHNIFGFSSLLNGNELLQRALQVVVIGDRSDPATQALLAAVHGISLPNLVLSVVAPGSSLPGNHPAFGKTHAEGIAMAYVCEGPVCSLPLTAPVALAADLAGR
jgi:uncharacterized protein